MPDGDPPPIPDNASACPSCGALIPIPIEARPAALSISHGRLAGAGCYVQVMEDRCLARLEMGTPNEVIHRGREPGRWLTRKGALVFLAGPPVVAALAVAFGLVDVGLEPLPAVGALLGLALLLALVGRWLWKPRLDLLKYAREHAWARLVPRLHARKFVLEESAFLAALALDSVRANKPLARLTPVKHAITLTERAVSEGRSAVRHLATLHRVLAAQARIAGEDPVPLLAAQLVRCFAGKMPAVFAEELLASREGHRWHEGDRTRLGLLVCDNAFEAGCEVRHLMEAGEVVPALADLLETDDVLHLARLRLLWSQRASRPWDRCGPAETAFELAQTPDHAELLERFPDLLLHQSVPLARPRGGQRAADVKQGEVITCGRGVVFQGVLFREPPSGIEVLSRGLYKRGGHKLVVGVHTFTLPDDPEPLARMLERWFRFHFKDFLPEATEVIGWKSSAGDEVLRRWGTVACPGCQRIVRVRAGKVGVALRMSPDAEEPPK